MKKQRMNRKKIWLTIIAAVTILFFAGENYLPDEWYYIPDRAIALASLLCVVWQAVIIAGSYSLSKRIKTSFSSWVKNSILVIKTAATIFLVFFLGWNCILYNLKFDVKMEQYDEHIALYVRNTFVRPEDRYPHYMYEENWLFMRRLSDEELKEAVFKYGNPDDYYNYQKNDDQAKNPL